MRLETHEGLYADPATIEDVARCVAGLTEIGEAFVILGVADETYIQAAGTIAEGFIVEYRDGCAGEHYRGDQRLNDQLVTRLLSGYLLATPHWKYVVGWHRVDVNADPVNN